MDVRHDMTSLMESTPALDRLRWLLDGLAGRWPDDVSARDVLAPDFAAVVSPLRFVEVMRERAVTFAPIAVTALDADGDSASARFRTRDGERWVARVIVEKDAPYRVVHGYAQPSVPGYLTAALPQEFGADSFARSSGAAGATLVVFGGVPGSGKSTVAEQVGATLDSPVFSLDWLLGALSPFGMYHRVDLMSVGNELLTTLAYRELSTGHSAIVDTTSEDRVSRSRWTSLATAAGATFRAVVCVCSDPELHRERVEKRQRGIAGWTDPGNWADVTARRDAFPPWPGSVTIDTAQDLAHCVSQVVESISVD